MEAKQICSGFSEILPGNADGGTHFRKAVIYPGMGGVLRVLQFLQRQICCDNQRLSAAVSAVNYVVNLFKPVFRATLHAEIIKDKQREAAKAGYVFVPVLVAGGKVIEDKGKVRHAHGNLFLHEGVGDTPGKIAFPCADTPP